MSEVPLYRGTSLIKKSPPPEDSTVGLRLSPNGPERRAISTSEVPLYRVTSLVRNRHPVGPYSRTMPRLLWQFQGGGFL